ncbi:uncharacterized protein LOC131075898 isoform X2 [Cryptomeria japonica]|nr:uncharacterized protein LOC131075898 isoform X2 [Cryptomeria japonica]
MEEEQEREIKVKKIIKQLKLDESKGNKVAVIIQGDSGESKTDLAADIYGRLEVELDFEGWKLCKKIFNKDMEFNPNVSELHSEIVNLFSVGRKKGKNGERIQITKNESAFLWIDNILRAGDVRKMFDMDFRSRNTVRLLVTSPNKSVESTLKESGFTCKKHEIEGARDTQIISERSYAPLLQEMVSEYLNRRKQANKDTRKKVSGWVDEENLVKTGFKFALENAFLNLSAPAQDAFLDICAFFVGWDWDEIPFIVGKTEVETLHENAWVTKSHNNKIAVPGVLCEWGLSRTKGVRLTKRDELKKALDSNQKIKGIFLPNDKEELQLPVDKLYLMETLRVLSSKSSISVVDKDKHNKSFQRLRFLHVGRSSKNLPFQLDQLRNLNYFSSDQDVDFNPSQLPPKLKVVKLCGDALFRSNEEKEWKIDNLRVLKLKNFQKLGVPDPKIFRTCEGLKELCMSTCSIVELPESLTQLYALRKLDLHDCKYLRKLPKSFGTIINLVKLDLGYCSSLRHLPESFGQLESLEELVLSYCSALKQLPESFVCLGKLKKVTFSHCQNMQKLPDKFELLSSLEDVDLSYCKNLKLLVANFEMLSLLQLLNLRGCSKLQKLPDNFPQTLSKPKLVAIRLSGCSSLTELPDEFCQGNMIEDLSLAHCTILPRLPSQINQLKWLRKLNLSGCEKLRELPKSFNQLTCLEVLNLRSCHKLRNLCNRFSRLKALRDLNLSDCPVLEGKWMKTLERNMSLRIVDIKGSPQLQDQWARWRIKLCRFSVLTGKERMPANSIEKILNRTTEKLFRGKAVLINKKGKPFSSREISEGSTLALIFDHNISRWDREMLENNVDELLTNLTAMKVIYVGKSFSAIPTKLVDQVIAYTPDHSEALSLFDKPLAETAGPEFWDLRTYIIKTVVDHKDAAGCMFLKGWESISGMLLGESFNIQDYHELEKMIALATPENEKATPENEKENEKATPEKEKEKENNNKKLLQLLFREKETEFMSRMTNPPQEKTIEKMVFLLISTLEISKPQISYLDKMFKEMQDTFTKHGFEVEWIWVPVTISVKDLLEQTYENLKQAMQWVGTTEPYLMDQSTTISVFFRERMGFCETPMLLCLAPLRLFSATDVMLKVATLGPEAWIFLNDVQSSGEAYCSNKLSEIQSSSHLYFLFTNFMEVSEKDLSSFNMIWLYGGDPEKISEFKCKLSHVTEQMGKDHYRIAIIHVGRRSFLSHINNEEEEEPPVHQQKLENINDIAWLSLTIRNVKRFWHYIHYLLYLIASKTEEKDKKLGILQRQKLEEEKDEIESKKEEKENEIAIKKEEKDEIATKKQEKDEKPGSLQRLMLALLSLDCLSRRNGTVWMMAIDGAHNENFTGKGKDLVDTLDSNIDKHINSRIKLRNGAGEVYSSKTEGEPLIKLIQSKHEVEDKQIFEDAPWLRAHPSSHLVEQISANMHCTMCCVEDPAYHCDMCGCFSICQKCYISEFIVRSKEDRGEQIKLR